MLASSTKYLIIGAGIHGLSTSYHLALELKKRGLGSGKDIIVIDKSGIGAGASGIACGVVRNPINFFSWNKYYYYFNKIQPYDNKCIFLFFIT